MEILDENDVQKWWFSIVGIFMPKCARTFNVLFSCVCVWSAHKTNRNVERAKWRNEWQSGSKRRRRKRQKIDHGTREDKKTQSAHKQPNALHYFSKNINLSYWYRRRVKHDVKVWARKCQNGKKNNGIKPNTKSL